MSMPGDIEIINTISIKNNGPAPIVRQNEVLGGIHSVSTLVDRDAIPNYLRQEGLVAFVQAGPSMFQLVGGISNGDWVPFGAGAASLQSAYDGGSTILQNLGAGPTTITNPAATAQPTLVLSQATAGQAAIDASGGDIRLAGGDYVVATGQRVVGTNELTLASSGPGGVVADAVAAGSSVDLRLAGASAWRVDGATGSLLAGPAGLDIGSSTVADRPDRVWVATEVVIGSTITINGTANTVTSNGNLTIDTGVGNTVSIGTSNANSVEIGSASADISLLGDVVVVAGRRIDAEPAGTLSLGTVDADTINIGSATSTANIINDLVVGGNLTVNGTTTTINSTNLTVVDRFILCADGSSNLSGGFAVSQANGPGNDLIFMWNDVQSRAEVGFGDSASNPAGVASFADTKVSSLFLAGTTIVADAGLTVTSTAASMLLETTGANAIQFATNGLVRMTATPDGSISWTGLVANPSLSAVGDATLYYNDTAKELRVSLDGGAYVALATATSSTWASVLANGASSGGTDPVISTGDRIYGQTVLTFGAGSDEIDLGTIDQVGADADLSIDAGNLLRFGPVESVSLELLRPGFLTTVRGALQVDEAADFNAAATFGSAAPKLTISAGANITKAGALSISTSSGGFSVTSAAGITMTPAAGSTALIGNTSDASVVHAAGGPTGGFIASTGGVTRLTVSATTVTTGIPVTSSAGNPLALNGVTGIELKTGALVTQFYIDTSGNITPANDGTQNFGSPTFKLNNVYAVNGVFGSTVTINGVTNTISSNSTLDLTSADGTAGGPGSDLGITAGSGDGAGAGGDVVVSAGASPTGSGGEVVVRTGDAVVATRLRVTPSGDVGIGAAAPLSTLDVQGSLGHAVATISSNATADDTAVVYLVDASGGPVTLSLPPAASAERRIYHVKKIDSSLNAVTIDGDGAETIDGQATQALISQYDALQLVSDGTEWFIL